MKKVQIYIGVLFLSTIILISCEKFDYEKYYEQPPDPLEDLPSYSYFKTGTYWIYKDSVTNALDSIYVFADTNYLYHQTNTTQEEGDYMFYGFRAYSSYDSCIYYYSISMGNYILSTREVGALLRKYKQTDYIGATYLMTNRFIEGDQIGYYAAQGITYYKQSYDSLLIGTNVFRDVVKFHHTKDETMELSPSNVYFSKHVGLIRKEKLNTNQVWELVRYQIIQ
ncbi:MAG: hypothetical protein L6Q66_02075 [Bacteroidia bacterium]|nr:hypothetical protein [Bacteroidia bacterium]